MDDRQRAKVNYFNKILSFRDENKEDIHVNDDAKEAFDNLAEVVGDINASDTQAIRDDSGITEQKSADENRIVELAYGFSLAGYSYFSHLNPPDLKLRKRIQFTLTELTGGADNDRYIHCKLIYDTVTPIVASLVPKYPDAVADLAELNNKLNAYFAEMQDPSEARGERSGYGDIAEQHIAAGDEVVESHVEPEMNNFYNSNRELYTRWLAVNKIDDAPSGSGGETFAKALSANEFAKVADIIYSADTKIKATATGFTDIELHIRNSGADVPGATAEKVVEQNTLNITMAHLAPSGNELWVKNLEANAGEYEIKVG